MTESKKQELFQKAFDDMAEMMIQELGDLENSPGLSEESRARIIAAVEKLEQKKEQA